MRLNRGTILLAIVLIVIIVAALLFSNNQPDTTSPTAIPTQETVAVFSSLDSVSAIRLAIMNNTSNNGTVLEREPGGEQWSVVQATGATVPTENREVDQTQIPSLLSSFTGFASPQSFDSDQLDTYGLANPAYTITLTADDGSTYTVYVGKANLSGGRYYAVVETATGDGAPETTMPPTEAATATPTPAESAVEATVEGTAEPSATPVPAVSLSGTKTIYLLASADINALTALVTQPPYLPLPTATPTPYPTANPISEVDQTATAAVDQAATAEAMMATLNALASLTPAATETPAMSTPEAPLSRATATP